MSWRNDVTKKCHEGMMSQRNVMKEWCHKEMSWRNDVVKEWCHKEMSWRNDVVKEWCHKGMMSRRNDVTKEWCHEGMMSQRNDVMKEWCHEGMISGCHLAEYYHDLWPNTPSWSIWLFLNLVQKKWLPKLATLSKPEKDTNFKITSWLKTTAFIPTSFSLSTQEWLRLSAAVHTRSPTMGVRPLSLILQDAILFHRRLW